MPRKPNVLDVWIVESNTVYRQVPFSVVTDWVQQGRLLPEDKVRPAGTTAWSPISSLDDFAPYVPQAEPFRAEDRAEALEPVHTEVVWKRPRSAEDDDVDMIPLIDVSLVLLVFFMMTTAVGGAASLIQTPTVEYKHLMVNPQMLWVGIRDARNGPTYAFGTGENGRKDLQQDLGLQQVVQLVKERASKDVVDVRVAADSSLPYDAVRQLTIELEKLRPKGNGTMKAGIRKIYAEVSEKEQK